MNPTKARVPLDSIDESDPILKGVMDSIRAKGGKVVGMHKLLAYCPPLFEAITKFSQSLRYDSQVPRIDRELVILRSSQMSHGEYEFEQHRGMALNCGLTAQQIDDLAGWKTNGLFNPKQQAILGYIEQSVGQPQVDDAVYDAVAKYFTHKELIELTATSALYVWGAQMTRSFAVPIDDFTPNYGYENKD